MRKEDRTVDRMHNGKGLQCHTKEARFPLLGDKKTGDKKTC